MTKEEAVLRLEVLKDFSQNNELKNMHEAIDIAIRSLEAWKKVEEDLNGDFTRQTKGFRYGIDYAIATIDKHLKKVER